MNVSNDGSKPEEFNLNDIEVLVDSKEENQFKRAHVGKFLGLAKILMSVEGLNTQEMPRRDDIKAMVILTLGLGLKTIKTRRINSSHSLGPCMSL